MLFRLTYFLLLGIHSLPSTAQNDNFTTIENILNLVSSDPEKAIKLGLKVGAELGTALKQKMEEFENATDGFREELPEEPYYVALPEPFLPETITELSPKKYSYEKNGFYSTLFAYQDMYHEYSRKVDAGIAIMRFKMKKIYMKSYCTEMRSRSPEAILRFLRRLLVDQCDSPISPEEAQERAHQHALLTAAIARFGYSYDPFPKYQDRYELPEPKEVLSEYMATNERIPKDVFAKKLAIFKKKNWYQKQDIIDFFDELRERKLIEKVEIEKHYCHLRAMAYLSFFGNPEISWFTSKIEEQMKDITNIIGYCADALYEGNTTLENAYKTILNEQRYLIWNHTSNWVHQTMASAWPSVHAEILRDQIIRAVPRPFGKTLGKISEPEKPENVNKTILEIVINATLPKLARTGLPDYNYDILIIHAPETNYEYYFEGDKDYCISQRGVFGSDTVIFRSPVDSKWENKTNISELASQIISEMSNLYNAPTLSQIIDALKLKIGQTFGFPCWSVARQWSKWLWSPCPKIDYVSSNSTNIFNFNYTNKGSTFQKCEEFQFFFFV